MDCARILLLVDGWPPAESAVEAAAALACSHRSSVAVTRVRRRAIARDMVLEGALARLRAAGVPAEGTVLVAAAGDAAAAVAEHAAAIGADVVVVGSRGLAGAPAVLLGSFSQRVAAELDLPMVVVRAQRGRPRFDSWLVGTADQREVHRLMATVATLAPGARVHVAAVAGPGVQNPVGIVRDAVEQARDVGLLASGQVVSGPDVAAALLTLAHEHGCDVIVLGSRRPRALEALVLGSVAQEVLHNTRVPVVLAGRP